MSRQSNRVDPPTVAEISRSRLYRSITTSRTGCEQQTRMLPSAGLSIGSGPGFWAARLFSIW
jgi:hypothetical protein